MVALSVLAIFFIFLIGQVQADVSQCPGITVPAVDMDTVSVWTDGVTSRLGISKPSPTATASSITAKTASMLTCPSDCSISLVTFVTSVGSQNSFLHIQEPLSVLVPGYFSRFPSTDNLRCVPYDGFCGATIPLYRHHRITSFGIQHAYSFSSDVSYQNFQMEPAPLCYFWETGTVAADPSSMALDNIPLSELATLNSFDNEASSTMKDHYTSTLTSVLGYTEGTPLGKVATNNSGKCDEMVALVQMVDQQTGAFARLDHKLVLEGQEPNRLFEQYTALPEKVYCVARPVCGATVPLWKMYDYVNLDSIMATSPITTSNSYLYPNAPLCYIWDADYTGSSTVGSNVTSTGGGLVAGEVTMPETGTTVVSTGSEAATTVSGLHEGTTVFHESSGSTEMVTTVAGTVVPIESTTVLSSELTTLFHESSSLSTGSQGTTVSPSETTVPGVTTVSHDSSSSGGVTGTEGTTVAHDASSGTTVSVVFETTVSHDSVSTIGSEATVSHYSTETADESVGTTSLSPEVTGITVSHESSGSTLMETTASEGTTLSHDAPSGTTLSVPASDVTVTTVSHESASSAASMVTGTENTTVSHDISTLSVPDATETTVSHSISTSSSEGSSNVFHEEMTTAYTGTTFPESPFTVIPGENATTMSTMTVTGFEGTTVAHETVSTLGSTVTGSEGTTVAVSQNVSTTSSLETSTVSYDAVSSTTGSEASTVSHDGASGTTVIPSTVETIDTTASHASSGSFSDTSSPTTMAHETYSSGTDHDMITITESMGESSVISTISPTFTMLMGPTTTVLPTSFIDIIENIRSSMGVSGTTESSSSTSGSGGTTESHSQETTISHDATTLGHDSGLEGTTIGHGSTVIQETTIIHSIGSEGTTASQVSEAGHESTTFGTTQSSGTTGANVPAHDVPSTWEQFFPSLTTVGSTGETTMSHGQETTEATTDEHKTTVQGTTGTIGHDSGSETTVSHGQETTEATTDEHKTTIQGTTGTIGHDSGSETTVSQEIGYETTTGTTVDQETTTAGPVTSALPGSFLPNITVTRPSWMGGGVALDGAGSTSTVPSTMDTTAGHESETTHVEMTTTHGSDGTTTMGQDSTTLASTESHNLTTTTVVTTTTLDSTDLFNLNG